MQFLNIEALRRPKPEEILGDLTAHQTAVDQLALELQDA